MPSPQISGGEVAIESLLRSLAWWVGPVLGINRANLSFTCYACPFTFMWVGETSPRIWTSCLDGWYSDIRCSVGLSAWDETG